MDISPFKGENRLKFSNITKQREDKQDIKKIGKTKAKLKKP
ncbi:MAG: hypothetical protein ACTSVI_09215 [Promethearchaeota archaeon]